MTGWLYVAIGIAFLAWQCRKEWKLLLRGEFGESTGNLKNDGWSWNDE